MGGKKKQAKFIARLDVVIKKHHIKSYIAAFLKITKLPQNLN